MVTAMHSGFYALSYSYKQLLSDLSSKNAVPGGVRGSPQILEDQLIPTRGQIMLTTLLLAPVVFRPSDSSESCYINATTNWFCLDSKNEFSLLYSCLIFMNRPKIFYPGIRSKENVQACKLELWIY